MLVQFTVKNFLSFKSEAILDMTAIGAYKEHSYNLIDIGEKEKYLHVAAIYGANASGKSNLHIAFSVFQNIIKESMNNVSESEEKILEKYFMPFAFDEDSSNTEFEIIVRIQEFEFKYGFEFNDYQIVSEWLYRKSDKTNRNIMIFERENEEIRFGNSIKNQCAIYKNQIQQEILLLSFFNKLRLKTNVFKEVYQDISGVLALDIDFNEEDFVLERYLSEAIDNDKETLMKFIEAIDVGIEDILYEERDEIKYFFTLHVDKKGEVYPLPLFNESSGTLKSIAIYLIAKIAIQYDKALFVDELNIKLHPLLLKFIIDLFYTKTSTAQLIFTTHDTTLLDRKFFRRDQIWFIQKDKVGHSELIALSDFKIRSDASFEKDYLAGVYGGIPYLKEFTLKEGE